MRYVPVMQNGISQLRHAARVFTMLATGVTAAFAGETALQPGEELTYAVRWAVLSSAGEIRIAAIERGEEGSSRLHITTSTATRGLAKSLLTFQAQSESVFDLQTGNLLSLHESSVARSKQTDYRLHFDPGSRRALYTSKDAAEGRELDVPAGDPADLITTLMKTRWWDLEVGQSRDVLVSFRDDFYHLTVHATRRETVKTPLGSFDTLVLEPRMEKTPPKGMFKRGGNVRVWVSNDDSHLPVRFQVDFKVGSGVATLVKYTPPVSTADARLAAEDE